jgi:hypothetical protein
MRQSLPQPPPVFQRRRSANGTNAWRFRNAESPGLRRGFQILDWSLSAPTMSAPPLTSGLQYDGDEFQRLCDQTLRHWITSFRLLTMAAF